MWTVLPGTLFQVISLNDQSHRNYGIWTWDSPTGRTSIFLFPGDPLVFLGDVQRNFFQFLCSQGEVWVDMAYFDRKTCGIFLHECSEANVW